MPYCPNCASELEANAPSCPKCKAAFGEGSAWKPLAAPPPLQGRAAGEPTSLGEQLLRALPVVWVRVVLGAVIVPAIVVAVPVLLAGWAISALLIALAAAVVGALIWGLTGGRKQRLRVAAEQQLHASAEQRLERLMYLSEQTARVESATLPKINALVDRCRDATRATRTCCAWIVHRDPNNEQLSVQGYLLNCWWIDFERPDSFLVTQQTWDKKLGNLFDQWVSVGDDTYQNAGFWLRGEKGAHRQFHEAYSIDGTFTFVEALTTSNVPSVFELRKDDSGCYFHIRYDDPARRHGLLTSVGELVRWACTVDVWISVDDAWLNKVQVSIAGVDRRGDRRYFEEHRAYGCQNERINVDPPPWLNAVPSADGKFKIIDDRVPVLHHYAASISPDWRISDPSSNVGEEFARRIRPDSETLH